MNKLSIEELKKYSLAANKEVASMADELIAIREMKGDQVPVAWYHATLALAKSDEDKKSLPEKIAARYNIPLIIAPQKPVVIGPNRKDMFWTAANAGFVAKCDNEWKAAIEAAGGVVRSEEREREHHE